MYEISQKKYRRLNVQLFIPFFETLGISSQFSTKDVADCSSAEDEEYKKAGRHIVQSTRVGNDVIQIGVALMEK